MTSSRAQDRQEHPQHLIQRPALLVHIADRLECLVPHLPGDRDRAVGAVVGDDDDPIGWPVLLPERPEGDGKGMLLVVGRDEGRDMQVTA